MGYVDEDEIRRVLVGRRIISADTVDNAEGDRGYLTLDDGVVLEVVGNEGCGGCTNGWYYVSHVATCDNIITNVVFDYEPRNERYTEDAYTYLVFVIAGDEKINVAQVDGDDGNGYYGSGYYINVKLPATKEEV